MSDETGDDEAGDDEAGDADRARERMERAIRAVRREGRKAAVMEATVEAVAVLLLVDLLFAVVPETGLPPTVPVPDAVAPTPAFRSIDTGAIFAVAAGLLAFAFALWLQLRRPAVERFGEVNPAVAEALRTARDAVRSDADGPMATRLYEETVQRLGEASSLGLLNVRRIAAALVLVAVIAPASIGATAAGFELGLPGGGDENPGPSAGPDEYGGLQDPSAVLGEAENVEAGDKAINATVGSQGSGGNESQAAPPGAYETGYGGAGGVDAESQQAGFADQKRLQDAELIREYNLRIRQDQNDDTQSQ